MDNKDKIIREQREDCSDVIGVYLMLPDETCILHQVLYAVVKVQIWQSAVRYTFQQIRKSPSFWGTYRKTFVSVLK